MTTYDRIKEAWLASLPASIGIDPDPDGGGATARTVALDALIDDLCRLRDGIEARESWSSVSIDALIDRYPVVIDEAVADMIVLSVEHGRLDRMLRNG